MICKGIAEHGVARASQCIAWLRSTARAKLGMAKICVAKRRHSKDRLGMAKHRSAKASQGIAWQCSARAEL